MIDNKQFSEVNEEDLQILITNSETEGKRLDFKRILPGLSDSDKKKFLADICAFANAGGGHIIYGIEESGGKAVSLPGIMVDDVEKEILRLESIIRNGIAPRIPGLQFRAINLSDENYALIIRIPVSWASPHMVSLEGSSKFYSRNSSGNYPLDIQEIRSAFQISNTLSNDIRNFRLERLGKVMADETPISLKGRAKIVLHLIPINAFNNQAIIDIPIISTDYQNLSNFYFLIQGMRINLDGVVTYGQIRNDEYVSYTQLFKNGIIEAVDCELLKTYDEEKPVIPSEGFEEISIDACKNLVGFQKVIGIEPPILVYLSMIGVKDYQMGLNQSTKFRNRRYPWARNIDRESLLFPEVIIENYEGVDFSKILHPVFDTLWNAAGWPKSLNYDDQGNWVGQKG